MKRKNTIIIDGSQGEGGGQIFRTALSLAMCMGTPVRIENIRARRKKPGLLRQHLACLRAAKAISNARVNGEAMGSSSVEFEPFDIKPGRFEFAVGSAGSTSLIFQTVLPALATSDARSHLFFEGGTHNGMAPSFDFLVGCFLPAIDGMGFTVEANLESYGFYPAGGGAWRALISPKRPTQNFSLVERGTINWRKAIAVSANLPAHVTQRELQQVRKKIGWSGDELTQTLVDSQGPGNIVSLRIRTSHVTEFVETTGELGVAAERIANTAIRRMQRYVNMDVPVGEYLADQLLVPMWLHGSGRFRSLKPSLHTQTNIDVIEQMTGQRIECKQIDDNVWEYSI